MKVGLLKYRSYNERFNIGDYIQSLAASQFFHDKIDVLVSREELNEYHGDNLKIILNGWFTHEPMNWPPSKQIIPHFISFHINSVARETLLKQAGIEYLKKYEPIGCRDKETVRLLVKHGVDAYFSGCLTLTLGISYKSTVKDSKIYFVDPYFELGKDLLSYVKYLIVLIKNFRTIRKISKSYFTSNSIKALIKMSAFYSQYSRVFSKELLNNALYINQIVSESTFTSEDAKFKYAKDLLANYSKASLMVTSRIHCALPCLGMEVPVIFVENENQAETSYCRLDGIRELFNKINYNRGKLSVEFTTIERIISSNTSINNKSTFTQLRDGLIDSCNQFVSNGN